jgi:hypothetical protein
VPCNCGYVDSAPAITGHSMRGGEADNVATQ